MKRVFLGVDLPKDLKLKIEDLKLEHRLNQLPVKLVEQQNSHIAIKFLDELADEQINEVAQTVEQATADFKRFEVKINGSLIFPFPQKPRVISLKVMSANLEGLVKKIFAQIDQLDFVVKEERKYVPHLTLGRVKDHLNQNEIQKIINLQFEDSFVADEIQLFESQLTDSGPIYNVLKRFPLK